MPLSLPETTIRSLLFCLINEQREDIRFPAVWLDSQIVKLQGEIENDSAPVTDVRALRRFYVKGERPGSQTLAACISLLEYYKFLETDHLVLAQQRSRKSKKRMPETGMIPPHRSLEGVHFAELGVGSVTKLNCLLLSEREETSFQWEAYRAVRNYVKQPDESAERYEYRLGDGNYDDLEEFLGVVDLRLEGTFFDFRGEHGTYLWGGLNGRVLIKDEQNLVLKPFDRQPPEPHKRIAPLDVMAESASSNLTKRQKNNIVRYAQRYLAPTGDFVFRRFMSSDLTSIDSKLLQAAKDQQPLEIMAALADGANINAIDPANGQTALHYVASGLDPYCLVALVYEPNYYPHLLDSLKKDTDLNVVEVDLAVRQAQARLDPLILDHEHRFASEHVDVPGPEEDDDADPTASLRLNNYLFLVRFEEEALQAGGLSPSLNNVLTFSLEERVRQLSNGPSAPKPSEPGL
ncbi:hypothetical protein TRP8649_02326 [Pelagimonas phthalicica]|uniref:Ankyrin repeat-containing protein n=1 Tax=Pelagimonas phthalicica TaxID=1037362 RepID=A0A238JBX6_9RHOB|nr:ankyrin repeat domain-containing protein [Pelagimonas phthalicica]TDS91164.1 ankyrin repeat protein [Pelagimonas phthalicica]SMX28211.1 hypothetical protein TRP8649_02326 [Pelagimonas phthalicica]